MKRTSVETNLVGGLVIVTPDIPEAFAVVDGAMVMGFTPSEAAFMADMAGVWEDEISDDLRDSNEIAAMQSIIRKFKALKGAI